MLGCSAFTCCKGNTSFSIHKIIKDYFIKKIFSIRLLILPYLFSDCASPDAKTCAKAKIAATTVATIAATIAGSYYNTGYNIGANSLITDSRARCSRGRRFHSPSVNLRQSFTSLKYISRIKRLSSAS